MCDFCEEKMTANNYLDGNMPIAEHLTSESADSYFLAKDDDATFKYVITIGILLPFMDVLGNFILRHSFLFL